MENESPFLSCSPTCTHWSWVPGDASAYQPVFHRSCWLKQVGSASDQSVVFREGIVSGLANRGRVAKDLAKKVAKSMEKSINAGEFPQIY